MKNKLLNTNIIGLTKIYSILYKNKFKNDIFTLNCVLSYTAEILHLSRHNNIYIYLFFFFNIFCLIINILSIYHHFIHFQKLI